MFMVNRMEDKTRRLKRKVNWSIGLSIIAILISSLPWCEKYLFEKPQREKEVLNLVANLSEGLAILWLREYTKVKKEIEPIKNTYIAIAKLQATSDQLDLKLNIDDILYNDINDSKRGVMPEYPPNIFRKRIVEVHGTKAGIVNQVSGYFAFLCYGQSYMGAEPIVPGSTNYSFSPNLFFEKGYYKHCACYINIAMDVLGYDIKLKDEIKEDYLEYTGEIVNVWNYFRYNLNK